MSNCRNCGKYGTEKHHIFFGTGQRKISEKLGFKVRLCPSCHRGQPHGVHGGNRELDLKLKRQCQTEYEKTHTREKFIKLIGRNYLED